MRDDSTFTGRVHDNERTICLQNTAPALPAPLGPREAFLAAHERLAAAAAAARGPALAVAAVDHRARVIDASLLPDREALVIGRHSECGLRLPGGAVSLRHIALLARRGPAANFESEALPAGEPTGPAAKERVHAHLWDLNTELPFSTEDGETTSALVSDGPIYVAVAEYALWIVPTELLAALPDRAKEAWEALPARRFLDRRSPGRVTEPAPAAFGERRPAPRDPAGRPAFPPDMEVTSVTMCAPALLLQEDEEPEIGWGELRLAGGGRKARHPISAERLERGVLLGRYDRCGLTVGGLDSVSRVHLLVVRIGDEVWAIDTASTNGVKRRGNRISAVVLDARDELHLAGSLHVTWTRAIHPEA